MYTQNGYDVRITDYVCTTRQSEVYREMLYVQILRMKAIVV